MDTHKLFDLLIPIVFVLFWAYGAFANKKRSKPGDEDEQNEGPVLRPLFSELEEVLNPEDFLEEASVPVTISSKEPPQSPSIQVQLERQRQAIKRKREEAARLMEKVKKNPYSVKKSRTKPHAASRSLIRGLATKQALRQSIVAYEILGTPVSLRQKDQLSLPWQR